MAEEDVLLYPGGALNLDDSFEIANAFPTRVILLMGEGGSGKTTLLAEIHHAFLNGPFAGYMFAGSRTLIGFEERCFLSRLQSGADKEDTERTKYADIRLLHLVLAPEASPMVHSHLLLTDVSGERFREIRTSADEARDFAPLVERADRIVLLVDGDRLSVAQTQMATESNACVLLRCLAEAGGLGSDCSLDLVISKWDYVVARRAVARVTEFEKSVTLIPGVPKPRFHRIAARVTNKVSVTAGFGMAPLVACWSENRSRRGRLPPQTVSYSSRSYQQYRFRQ